MQLKARKIISYVLTGIIIGWFLSGNNAISISKTAYAKEEISDVQEGNYIVKAKNAKQRKNIIAEYEAEKSVCGIIRCICYSTSEFCSQFRKRIFYV